LNPFVLLLLTLTPARLPQTTSFSSTALPTLCLRARQLRFLLFPHERPAVQCTFALSIPRFLQFTQIMNALFEPLLTSLGFQRFGRTTGQKWHVMDFVHRGRTTKTIFSNNIVRPPGAQSCAETCRSNAPISKNLGAAAHK
jgi:hypothetical protein